MVCMHMVCMGVCIVCAWGVHVLVRGVCVGRAWGLGVHGMCLQGLPGGD